MKNNMDKIMQYIKAEQEYSGETLLELFYRYYAEEHPMVSDAIYEKFARIRSQYTEKGDSGFDSIFYTVCELCLEYERVSFLRGFRTGAQWAMETFEI